MAVLVVILVVAGLGCFLAETARIPTRLNLVALGLFCVWLAALLSQVVFETPF